MNVIDHRSNEILLVDDEEDIRDVLSISLEDLGYQVEAVENAHHALERFEAHPFPIVMTDIKMPGMDGIELLKKIKLIAPFTEVIMITGHGDMDLAIESFRNEAVEFITKPVDVTQLEAAVRRAEAKIETRDGVLEYTRSLENMVWKKSEALKILERDKESDGHFSQYGGAVSDQQQIADLMSTLPMVIFFIDENYRVTTVNQRFESLFGLPEGKTCHSLCRGQAVPCRECPAMKTFQDGKPRQVERHFTPLIPKGEEMGGDDQSRNINRYSSTDTATADAATYLSWISPIMDDVDAQVSEVLVMATEIGSVMDIQDHLTSLGLMIGSVSHGIKGLLTGLDGGVYLLNSALNKDDQNLARQGLETVKDMTAKIRKMILDILFYAKERELVLEAVDAIEFAKDLVGTMKRKVDAHHIALNLELPEKRFSFEADEALINAALINIFDNAVDACIEDIETGGSEAPEITFRLQNEGDRLTFTIKDNGIGMASEDIQKAFTLFHSGKGKKGTGLGLFIAKESIEKHHGRIDATSEKGVGTTFQVSLPLSP